MAAGDRAFAQRILRRYGLTVEEYDAIWAAQGGKCPICGKPLKRGRGKAAIDHDHHVKTKKGEPKKVRGILCGMFCNKRVVGAIERIGEERTWNALVYLRWL